MTTESLAPLAPLAAPLSAAMSRDAPRVARHARTQQRREPDRAEARLARRLRDGDPDALSELYTRYGATTFGFLVRTLGDRAAAEDVQQQVFTEVWRRSGEYDPRRAGLLTWTPAAAPSTTCAGAFPSRATPRPPGAPWRRRRTRPPRATRSSTAGA
jgi:RNA polymerase sigma-70 factor (ECF subfamily)